MLEGILLLSYYDSACYYEVTIDGKWIDKEEAKEIAYQYSSLYLEEFVAFVFNKYNRSVIICDNGSIEMFEKLKESEATQ